VDAHTTVNLKADVENYSARFGLADSLETRLGREPLDLENCAVSYQRLVANYRIPFGHTHDRQEEVYVVVSGGARAKINEQIVELAPWDAVRIPAGCMRQFEAGSEGVEMLIVGAPVTGGDDDKIVADWWTD
jgi:mannose-6-phosphate isomerase-like protein (cupin superfamily)